MIKQVLETSLEAEMDQHLGYAKHERRPEDSGNSRNGTRTETVLTDVGPIDVNVPHDRDATFDPKTCAQAAAAPEWRRRHGHLAGRQGG